jgi:hypothetical protein
MNKNQIKFMMAQYKKYYHATLGCFLFTAILLLRRPDSILNPQFWAEDGNILFSQCYYTGFVSVYTPYAGYLLLIPRIISLLASQIVSYQNTPLFYNISCLIICLITVANIYSDRVCLKNKLLFVISLCLVPCYGNEIFMNITNVQWITSVLIIIILIKKTPSAKYGNIILQWAGDIMALIFTALTGPFIVFLFPLYLLNLFKNKSTHSLVLAAIAGLASLVQVLALLISCPETTNYGISFEYFIKFIEYKLSAQYLYCWIMTYKEFSIIYLAIYIAILIYVFELIYNSKNKNSIIFLYCYFIFILVSFVRMKGNPDIFNLGCGNRYLYIPYVMMAWILINEMRANNKKIIIPILLMILCSSLSSRFTTTYNDLSWRAYSLQIGEKNLNIPINPPGWSIFLTK